jgi:hypothetical protein
VHFFLQGEYGKLADVNDKDDATIDEISRATKMSNENECTME